MKRSRKSAGISLVSLVITIIVLIILTAVVIVTFMEGGIIDNAKESVFKNDIKTYQEQLVAIRGEEQIKVSTQAGYESKIIGKTITDKEEIKGILPEFKVEEYGDLFQIIDGKLVLVGTVEEDSKYEEWLKDLGYIEGTNECTNEGTNEGTTPTLKPIGEIAQVGDYVDYNIEGGR